MTACRCEHCAQGNQAPTYTEAHKRACLVLDIARTPGRLARRERIARWRKRHGDASADALMDEVMEVFKNLRASAAGGETPAAGFGNVVEGERTMTQGNFSMRGSA